MAVYFDTKSPSALLKSFDAAIEQEEAKGKIRTWKKTEDGEAYTHTSNNWQYQAFFEPHFTQNGLKFNIIKNVKFDVSNVAYGYYHGHLIETFLNHFDQQFSVARASPLPKDGDVTTES